MESSKSIHWLLFLKKQRVMRHYFFYVSTDVKWKTCSPYFSLLATMFTSTLYACIKQIFLTKEEIPLYIRSSKLLYGKGKITLVCFKQIVKDAKMLIKLIAVVSNHFTRYKCKMMHCLLKHYLSISQQLFLMIIKSIRSMKCYSF